MIDYQKIDRGALTRKIKKYVWPFAIFIILFLTLSIVNPKLIVDSIGISKSWGFLFLLLSLSSGMNIYTGFKYHFLKSGFSGLTGPDFLGKKTVVMSSIILLFNLVLLFCGIWLLFFTRIK